MRRQFLVSAAITLLFGLIPAQALADPPASKISICHWDNDAGDFHPVTVAASAETAHRNHGDGMIGEPVPSMEGFTFGEGCVPVRNDFLVRATSTDMEGNLRVIAALEDTNGDDLPSVGDTVKFYEYPKDFTGTSYGTFTTITECVMDSLYYWPPSTLTGHGSDCPSVQWLQGGSYFDYFVASGIAGLYETTSSDQLNVPSGFLSRSDTNDDAWLNVEFNITP